MPAPRPDDLPLLPLWPTPCAAAARVDGFRKAWLSAPIQVAPGHDPKASRDLWAALLPSSSPNATQAIPGWCLLAPPANGLRDRLVRALAAGADPSAPILARNLNAMPLSVAADLGLEEAVEILLSAGARRAWPKSDIPESELPERDPEFLPDPFASACRTWAWLMTSVPLLPTMPIHARVARRLGSPGLARRPDPCTGRTPLQEIAYLLDDTVDPGEAAAAPAFADLAQAMWTWWQPGASGEQVRALADGKATLSNFLSSGRLPDMVETPVRALARAHLLRAALDEPLAPALAPSRPRM